MFKSALTKDAFLTCLSSDEKIEFETHTHRIVSKKGQMIFTENGVPFGCYFLIEGKVKLFKTGVLGKKQIFQICKNGDLFGFHPVLNDTHYPDSAESLIDSKLQFLPSNLLKHLLKTNNDLCLEMLKASGTEFARFIGQETMLSQKRVPERVATVLFYLSKIYSENGTCVIPLSRTDLSDLCGTVKETLVRVLHDLKDEGIIDTIDNKGTICIKNFDLLKQRGEIVEAEFQ